MIKLPKPPKDLWEQMDAMREKYELLSPPDDAFTLRSYARRYNLTPIQADLQLKKLCAIGTVKRWGLHNRNIYFQLV